MMLECPKIRAIIFVVEEDYGRSVTDIFEVSGVDRNAYRRMRRYIKNRHGDCSHVDEILYEIWLTPDEDPVVKNMTRWWSTHDE